MGQFETDPLPELARLLAAGSALALIPGAVHTQPMTLKTAALLALLGMILALVLTATSFVNTLVGVLNDVTPTMLLLPSLIHLLASLGMVIFLFVFHKSQA